MRFVVTVCTPFNPALAHRINRLVNVPVLHALNDETLFFRKVMPHEIIPYILSRDLYFCQIVAATSAGLSGFLSRSPAAASLM